MDNMIVEIIVLVALGIGIGFIIGLTGVGAGVLVLPALTEIMGLPTVTAVGTAGMYAFIAKIYGGYQHNKLKNIDYGISKLFLIGGIPGIIIAIMGMFYFMQTSGLDKQVFQLNLKLYLILPVMVAAIILISYNVFKNKKTVKPDDLESNSETTTKQKISGIICGFIIGAIIGLTGISGVILVSILTLFFGLSARKTAGTTVFIALALTLVMSLLYKFGPDIIASITNIALDEKATKSINFKIAIIMAVGSFLGIYFGAKLSVKAPERKLKIFVIILLICTTSIMAYKTIYGKDTKPTETEIQKEIK